jgi:thiopeptide-type bacteriocin biosynthesis protein
VDGDRRLPIDLDSVLFHDIVVELVQDHTSIAVEEQFYGPDDLLACGPEGRFAHELVVPFLRQGNRAITASVPSSRAAPPDIRSFPPGSEWLYAKIYTGPASADAVLRRVVRPVVQDAVSGGAADRWFFVRYADPDPHLRLRLHGDPACLLDEVLPALLDRCARLHAEGVVWRTQLDTYEREVERYGGPAGIILAEQMFHADSDTALDAIETVPGDEGTEVRWRLVLLGLDRLLGDLDLDPATRLAIVRAGRDRLRQEFLVDRALRRRLGERFRRERAVLESLLDPEAAEHPSLARYAARSRATRSIARDLTASAQAGHLTRPLSALAGSFLHLHANRMLPSAARAQELVLHDFLYRLYESRAARQRDQR